MSTKCRQTLYFLPFLGDTFCMVFYSIFKRKKENGKGHYWYYCYTDPVRNVCVQKRCLDLYCKTGSYAMYVRVFFFAGEVGGQAVCGWTCPACGKTYPAGSVCPDYGLTARSDAMDIETARKRRELSRRILRRGSSSAGRSWLRRLKKCAKRF